MSRECLYNLNNREKATYTNSDILQRLHQTNEETLSNGLFDGKGNPVGKIAILNHRFNWATTAAAHGIEKQAKTAEQLPNFRQFAQLESGDIQHDVGNQT